MKVTRFFTVSAILVALAAAPVFAQTTGWTDGPVTVNINANMPELTQLRFEEGNTTLDLVTAEAVTLGTMYERSNNAAGYTVTLSSANSGALLGPDSETAPYSLTYDGATVNLDGGSATLTTANARTSLNGVPRVIVVTPLVDGEADFLAAGAYEDILTFEIAGE